MPPRGRLSRDSAMFLPHFCHCYASSDIAQFLNRSSAAVQPQFNRSSTLVGASFARVGGPCSAASLPRSAVIPLLFGRLRLWICYQVVGRQRSSYSAAPLPWQKCCEPFQRFALEAPSQSVPPFLQRPVRAAIVRRRVQNGIDASRDANGGERTRPQARAGVGSERAGGSNLPTGLLPLGSGAAARRDRGGGRSRTAL